MRWSRERSKHTRKKPSLRSRNQPSLWSCDCIWSSEDPWSWKRSNKAQPHSCELLGAPFAPESTSRIDIRSKYELYLLLKWIRMPNTADFGYKCNRLPNEISNNPKRVRQVYENAVPFVTTPPPLRKVIGGGALCSGYSSQLIMIAQYAYRKCPCNPWCTIAMLPHSHRVNISQTRTMSAGGKRKSGNLVK